jgi:hypothetical protein
MDYRKFLKDHHTLILTLVNLTGSYVISRQSKIRNISCIHLIALLKVICLCNYFTALYQLPRLYSWNDNKLTECVLSSHFIYTEVPVLNGKAPDRTSYNVAKETVCVEYRMPKNTRIYYFANICSLMCSIQSA